MNDLSIYDKIVCRAILSDKEANVTTITNLQNIYSALLDPENYAAILRLLKEKKYNELPHDILPVNGVFREYIHAYSFLNQDERKFIATIYDNDELWQDPQVIDIISV